MNAVYKYTSGFSAHVQNAPQSSHVTWLIRPDDNLRSSDFQSISKYICVYTRALIIARAREPQYAKEMGALFIDSYYGAKSRKRAAMNTLRALKRRSRHCDECRNGSQYHNIIFHSE